VKKKLAPRRALSTTPDVVLRPVVGLDIDGTLGYWHEHFLWFAGEYLGRPMPLTYCGTGHLYQEMRVSKSTYRQIKLAYRQSGLKRAMPVVDGSAELVQSVRRAGAEVWVCTTRPYLRLDNIDPDTRYWLHRNGITFDGVLFGERKYHDLSTLVGSSRVVGVLDDLPEQVASARAEGLPARLISRPHNENREDLAPLPDLPAARKWLLERIRLWKERHGV
jgi:hypothetical protein